MLERIEQIQGVGLLHNANGKKFKCQKATLIYADNGRGKTTLAGIFRSCATADAAHMASRRTLDGSLTSTVRLQFASGHMVTFTAGKWSEARTEFLVFDSEFIDKNVHSGGVVSTGHRRNLLQFALGEKAVSSRLAEDEATTEAKEASNEVVRFSQQLSGYHQGISLAAFELLDDVAMVDQQIDALQKRIAAANNSALIRKRALPAIVPLPNLEIDAIFALLRTTIENVQEDAESIVRAHVEKLGAPAAEAWLSQGTEFDNGQNCPYCAQPSQNIDLIRAYRTHFNAAYTGLKSKVETLDQEITEWTAPSKVATFNQGATTANAAAAAWQDHLAITPTAFDEVQAQSKLQRLQALFLGLVALKQTNPISAVGSQEDQLEAKKLWGEITRLMETSNLEIEVTRSNIESFRLNLEAENVQKLQAHIQQLQFSKGRHSIPVKAIIAQLAAARLEATNAEQRKKTARDSLDALMKKTLKEYEQTINSLLKKFGASFLIEKMDANFRGNSPRSEYGLALRGKSISLEGGPPSFATTLSEGDKRTLAFAFFVASTVADPEISRRVVIIDDPMCSFDLNRKQHTRTALKQIFEKAEQVVVLSHDLFFIRDLREALIAKDNSTSINVFQLRHAVGDYTDFAHIDVDKECESPYYRHHRLLSEFTDSGSGDHAHVAKAIRPLLEGYLHRRFPGHIPRDVFFGQVVGFIKDAVPPHPACHAKGLVGELNEINDYAGQFHHDTNPDKADSVTIVPTELRTFTERALNIVYKGAL